MGRIQSISTSIALLSARMLFSDAASRWLSHRNSGFVRASLNFDLSAFCHDPTKRTTFSRASRRQTFCHLPFWYQVSQPTLCAHIPLKRSAPAPATDARAAREADGEGGARAVGVGGSTIRLCRSRDCGKTKSVSEPCHASTSAFARGHALPARGPLHPWPTQTGRGSRSQRRCLCGRARRSRWSTSGPPCRAARSAGGARGGDRGGSGSHSARRSGSGCPAASGGSDGEGLDCSRMERDESYDAVPPTSDGGAAVEARSHCSSSVVTSRRQMGQRRSGWALSACVCDS